MGRSTKSVARVYADVNARFGASWYEYGTIATITLFPIFTAAFADNLQVQWGSQDHYEIVRKVGRGKYSEVSATFRLGKVTEKGRSGVRRNKRGHRGEVYYQGVEASQEEENKARNKDTAKFGWRSQYCCPSGRRSRSNTEDSKFDYRICPQRRFQGLVPPLHRSRCTLLYVRASKSQSLLLKLSFAFPDHFL